MPGGIGKPGRAFTGRRARPRCECTLRFAQDTVYVARRTHGHMSDDFGEPSRIDHVVKHKKLAPVTVGAVYDRAKRAVTDPAYSKTPNAVYTEPRHHRGRQKSSSSVRWNWNPRRSSREF